MPRKVKSNQAARRAKSARENDFIKELIKVHAGKDGKVRRRRIVVRL